MGAFWNRKNNFLGGKRDDVLVGNDANNHLWGRSGDDTLEGGGGSDTFHMSRGTDTVLDFQNGVDKIGIAHAGADDIHEIVDTAVQVGDDVLIHYDFHHSNMLIEGLSLSALTADDFTLL